MHGNAPLLVGSGERLFPIGVACADVLHQCIMLSGGEMETYHDAAALEGAVGTETGPTEWFTIDQNRINGFADVTEDHQWIHTDAQRAAAGPFGKTMPPGFLPPALLLHLLSELRRIDGA